MPVINLGSRSAGGVVSLGYIGPYTGAGSYPYTCPHGAVDRKSLFYGQLLTSGSTFRFTADPVVGVLDKAAGEAQTPPWSHDINDIYALPGGYTGQVTIGLELQTADGIVSAWTVTMTAVDGAVVDVRFIRPIARPIKHSIKRSVSA